MRSNSRVRIGFFAAMLFLSLLISKGASSLIPLIAAFIHELGHIAAARLLSLRFKKFTLGIFGARLELCDPLISYGEEILLCLGGPLINLLTGSFSLVLTRYFPSPHLTLFALSSLLLGFLNLLPIRDFDGGRILRSVLLCFFSEKTSDSITSILSFSSLFFLWSVSLYLLLRYTSSLSLFVFSVSVFASVFVSRNRNSLF